MFSLRFPKGDDIQGHSETVGVAMYNFKEIYHTVLKEYPDIMTVEEMSKALGVSSKTGYKLIKEGVIKSRKVGRAYRIAKVHLLSYLKVNM